MEWKRVKSALIILFLMLDVFLAYKVYQKNTVTNSDTLDALNSILVARNVEVMVNVKDIEMQSKMSKLLITSETGINRDIMVKLDDITKEAEYIITTPNKAIKITATIKGLSIPFFKFYPLIFLY